MHPFAVLLYVGPDLYSLIPSFVLSYRPYACSSHSSHSQYKDRSDPGENEYLNVSKICQKGAYRGESAFPLK